MSVWNLLIQNGGMSPQAARRQIIKWMGEDLLGAIRELEENDRQMTSKAHWVWHSRGVNAPWQSTSPPHEG